MSKPRTGPSRPSRPVTKKSNTQAKKTSQNTTTTRAGEVLSRRSNPARPVRGRAEASFRSRHPVLTALVPVVVVIVAVATMVIIKTTGSSGPSTSSSRPSAGGTSQARDTATTPLPAGVLTSLSSVSPSTFASVGSPGGLVLPSRAGDGGAALQGTGGKPDIVYIGAEYCPYCAAERWALAVALSRFGTFSNLSATHSSSDDVYPNTQTLSFYGSHYSSPYVDFQPVEEETNQQVGGAYPTLQTPTAAESALLAKYDNGGSIPFVDIGNKYVITGASYSPQVLQGLSQSQIASQLDDPSSPVAQAIVGTANNITAAICSVTGNQPSDVCNTPVIQSIAHKLGT